MVLGERPPGAADDIERLAPGAALGRGIQRRYQPFRFAPRADRIAQRQGTDRQGQRLADPTAADGGKFEAAAAKIADHALRAGNAAEDAHAGKARLFGPRKHFDRRAQRRLGDAYEFLAVEGVPDRRRRDGANAVDAHAGGDHAEPGEDRQRRRPPGGVEPGRREQVPAEPAHRLLVEYRSQRSVMPIERDHADGVRSDIDDGGTRDAACSHIAVSKLRGARDSVARRPLRTSRCRVPKDLGCS